MSVAKVSLAENFFHEPIDLHRSSETTSTIIDQVELIVSKRSLDKSTPSSV